jgi:ligand-binding sensor domain-containing protein
MRKNLIVLVIILALLLSACTSNGGILGGGNWQVSGLSGKDVQTLTVDSNNAQNIYAGDTQGNVFVSTDGGLHWVKRNNGLPSTDSINDLSFDATGKKLYTATDQGLFMSTNGAKQWNAVGASAKGLTTHKLVALTFDLNAAHTIYAASPQSVFESTDDGTTWTTLSGGLPATINIFGLTFETAVHRLWAATSKGVYSYNLATSTWQAMNNGLPSNIQVYTVQSASNVGGAAGLIYVGTNQGFFRSVDAGGRWLQSTESLQRTRIHAVFVDFQQPTTVYVGTNIGVLESTDSGQDWGGVAPDFPSNQQVNAIQLGANGYTQLFVAANAVYYFPGTSGGLSTTNLIPIVIILILFYLLYRFTRRNQRRQQLQSKQPPTQRKQAESGKQPPAAPL